MCVCVFFSPLDGLAAPAYNQVRQEQILEQIVHVSVPQVQEIAEFVKVIPQERVLERIAKQIVDIPIPQIVEEIVDVAQIIPQDRFQQCTVEQILKETVEGESFVPHEHSLMCQSFRILTGILNWRICSLMSPLTCHCPQVLKEFGVADEVFTLLTGMAASPVFV